MIDADAKLVEHWRHAVARPEVAEDLRALFADAAREIEQRAPVCWASGRCCNFAKTGHRLFVTGLEAAYTIAHAHAPTGAALDAAEASGGCPYQAANLCGVHLDKPLGCRLYFCDRSVQEWQHDLYERLMLVLRALHDRHRIEYRYGEWRQMLRMFVDAGNAGR